MPWSPHPVPTRRRDGRRPGFPRTCARPRHAWVKDQTKAGGIDWYLQVVFLANRQPGPLSLSAVAVTVFHEFVHLLQPDPRPLDAAVARRLAGSPSPMRRWRLLAYQRFE